MAKREKRRTIKYIKRLKSYAKRIVVFLHLSIAEMPTLDGFRDFPKLRVSFIANYQINRNVLVTKVNRRCYRINSVT